ncbi:succinate dehydrogenase cytochrome b subunit [Taibaiella lutea]|uniref:Succinate dehydrogenase cytochrome b subunit n=1 Tax=Taibaiella lutea TaxID=2608001 RepID=A0A5M6CMQ3_9BACT|nr:succinate dehydrogenase cytochrome b subunit [Taibaiella lutea]KAA5536307.1 succinate dehydrogenase cytochrome b subunit [Taibaiella lutea]
MNWKHAFTSSIGKKLVMGITGVSLIAFLCVHCYVNSLVFINVESFNDAAHFLGTNLLMHIAEVGLFAGIILHIVQGLMLTFQNQKMRPVGYEINPGNKSSKWYSRSMGLLGTLILLFLVLHLWHFWGPNRYNQITTGEEISLYDKMQATFSELWVVIVYILGCIALAYHLLHGFWSAFQTLGLSTSKYRPIIRGIGYAFSIIVPFIFIMMPIAFYMHWV